jgi:hypothetical protein
MQTQQVLVPNQIQPRCKIDWRPRVQSRNRSWADDENRIAPSAEDLGIDVQFVPETLLNL